MRPTGLIDPALEVRPAGSQVDDLLGEVRESVEKGERVLVTTLTKRMAEDLTEYLNENGVKVRYLHSDIDTVERVEIIRDLRLGKFDVLVGINLLREGLDMPEVALVAILDADKEGFLRSDRSLIQTIGRAARNLNGRAILYGDKITGSMRRAIDETERRREKQLEHNKEQGITPQGLKKMVRDIMDDPFGSGPCGSGPSPRKGGLSATRQDPRDVFSSRHSAALANAFHASVRAFATMVVVVLAAFLAAGLTDFRAQRAELFGEFTALGHILGGQPADGGALHVQADAFRHHFGVLFLQAGRRAEIAVGGAAVAGFDAFSVVDRHDSLLE